MSTKPAISTSTIPQAAKIQTGIPAGPLICDGDWGVPGISGKVAPQIVQNFWAENSNAAPHFGQNRGGMVVRGGLPSG